MRRLLMQNRNSAPSSGNLSIVIIVDEGQFENHLGEKVRSAIEETLMGRFDSIS
jgi:hypothetical protein